MKTNPQFFDVHVGYFCTSRFYRLYPELKNVDKILVLVGMKVGIILPRTYC